MSSVTPPVQPSDPPNTWPLARRLARGVADPVERFLSIEAASGVLLLLAALIALGLANSPWAEFNQSIWHTKFGLQFGSLSFERDLHFWINDGLMTIFFFVVGLEIRREMHNGELSEVKRAVLPIVAALGGMLLPALIFLAFNVGRPSVVGWGVPMATDIAFAVGILALLGKRVAPALRILLLALAVIDDVGAILVIALFYSSGFVFVGFAALLVGVVIILLLQVIGVRSTWAYFIPALVIWGGAYAGGVHPTLAGVIIGLLTPVKAWYGQYRFAAQAEATAQAVGHGKVDTETLVSQLHDMKRASQEALSPVERLQHELHGVVAYVIMPLFALANAGVALGGASFDGDAGAVFIGVFAGLVVGKLVGILGFCWVATRLGVALWPRGVKASHVSVVGMVGGVGFTMAIFIAQLAFPVGVLQETAKLAILCASGAAAVLALLLGRFLLPAQQTEGALSHAEAEASSID